MNWFKKGILYLLFVIYGQICFILSLRTNIFSLIQRDYSLDYSHIATVVLISGIIMQISTYLAGIIMKRWGYKNTLSIGLMIVATSILSMFFIDNVFLFDILFTIFMFGFGICTLVLNMYAGTLGADSRGKTLMKLHLSASIGLCMGPTFISKLIDRGVSWQMVVAMSSIPVFVLIIILFFTQKEGGAEEDQMVSTTENRSIRSGYKSFVVWMFIVIFTCAQIWEFGVGTWFIIYAKHTKNLSDVEAAKYLTIFLVSFPIGRIIYSRILEYIGYHRSIFMAFICNFILIFLGLITNQLILIALTGLFTCLMYPVMMSMMQEEFGDGSSDLIGWICMVGGILQYILMWSVGKLGDVFGIKVGFGSLIIYMIIGSFAVILVRNSLGKSKISIANQ